MTSHTMKQRALLIGINYVNSPNARLRGCANDVVQVRDFLTTRAGFRADDIAVYTDEDPATRQHTTGMGIVRALHQLVKESHEKNLDTVWIHYSGHGTGVRDLDGDEADGRDEAIVPSDFNLAGVITDDHIHQIVRRFNRNTKVICVFDCCHSGSMLDLQFKYMNGDFKKDTSKAMDNRVLMISGCMDSQTSADAYNVMNRHRFSGALTSCMLLAYESRHANNVVDLVDRIRDTLRVKGFPQVPQLTCSYNIKGDKRLFV